jgi:hypothetical protein
MKFTSIVFAALVAATQFSSTFAAGTNLALADDATTAFDTAVIIDVALNDDVDNGSSAGSQESKSVAAALRDSDILDYDLTKSTTVTAAYGTVDIVVVTDRTKVADTFKYTPNAGFVGDDEFEYTFTISNPSAISDPFGSTRVASTPVKVKVTVSPAAVGPKAIKQTFEIPGVVSSGNAIKYTHDGIFDIAALTPAAPDTKVFTAIVKPVLGDSDNFVANTSPKNVQQNFRDMIFDFSNIFRRDGN